MSAGRERLWPFAGWTLAALATWLAAFVLPYRFPLQHPVLSDTWVAGANNQVASIAIAVVGVLVCVVKSWWTRGKPAGEITVQPLPRRYLAAAIAAAILWTFTLGLAVSRARIYWGDEGYFLNQLRTGLLFHRHLYTQFEFAYGPFLYVFPATLIRLLTPFGISTSTAYLVSLATLQTVGLGLLFYTIQALPMRLSLKSAAFLLITFGTLTSLLGLNYSIFRFILPFATITFLSRQKALKTALTIAFLGEIIQLATSPELGLAFLGATAIYAFYQGITLSKRWFWLAPSALAGALTFAAAMGPAYFSTLRNVARGGFNLLLSPAPHIVVLLIATVALAPIAVVRLLKQPSRAALILSLYVAALGLLPAALGRSDPIHAFFDGLGMYLLAFVALDAAPPRWRRAWVAAVAIIFVLTQARNFRLYQHRLQMVLGRVPIQPDRGFNEALLLQTLNGARISAPILAPPPILDDLTRTGQYVPDYFCGWVAVWDSAAEERKIDDMRRTPYALVAFADPPEPDPIGDRHIATLMRLGLSNHAQRPPYIRGAMLAAELKSHWKPLGIYGDYVLYRQQS